MEKLNTQEAKQEQQMRTPAADVDSDGDSGAASEAAQKQREDQLNK